MGDVVPLFGASNGGEQQKNREMGWALAIDGRRLNILHTTTNQKQAAAMEGTMKGSGGSTIPSFLGGITVEWRLKT